MGLKRKNPGWGGARSGAGRRRRGNGALEPATYRYTPENLDAIARWRALRSLAADADAVREMIDFAGLIAIRDPASVLSIAPMLRSAAYSQGAPRSDEDEEAGE